VPNPETFIEFERPKLPNPETFIKIKRPEVPSPETLIELERPDVPSRETLIRRSLKTCVSLKFGEPRFSHTCETINISNVRTI